MKLSFDSPEQARAAVKTAGAALFRPRRLQQDTLFDTPDGSLRQRRCVLRIRQEDGGCVLTFKGPPQPGAMKLREEHETRVDNGPALRHLLAGLGYAPWFRYDKYREEFRTAAVIVAIDETPVGTFVELEGDERGILETAHTLGRSPGDFILESYRALFLSRRERFGIRADDMVFSHS